MTKEGSQGVEWLEEETLATRLGVDREKTRAARPTDVRRSGNSVMWPLEAARAFAKKNGLLLPEPEKNAAAGDGSEVLKVLSSPDKTGFHFGRHLIRAARDNGEPVFVRVTDSSKFRQRLQNGELMTFRAKKEARFPHWTLTGREPRWPGIW